MPQYNVFIPQFLSMRFLLLVALFMLPQVLLAQFREFADGFYVLTASPTVRHQAQLKLRNEKTLLTKENQQKKQEVDLSEVQYFQIGSKKFKPVGGFHIKKGLGGTDVQRGFAQMLDSGQVILYEYSYYIASGPMMSGSGAMYGGGNSLNSVFLLQKPGENTVTLISANAISGAGKEFRQALAPFLTTRPDLLKHLDERRLTIWHLPLTVHALNNGLPYYPVSPWADQAAH